MANLNAESITSLRELFDEMKVSRRQLKPILADIAQSIDKGFFIDAGSEEVTILLRQILDAQEKFTALDIAKKTTTIDQLDRAISALEQDSKRNSITAILAKFDQLEVHSDNAQIQDAVNKIQLQTRHLISRAGKWDVAHLVQEAQRFLTLAEVLDNIDSFSTDGFLKVTGAFPDNPLIAMALTERSVRFSRPAESVLPARAEESSAEKSVSIEPTIQRLNATTKKFNQVNPPQELIIADDADFHVEKAQVKKQLSAKSFSKKLHELLSHADPTQFFKTLVHSRVMFATCPPGIEIEQKFSKKIAALVPTLLDRLFNWGAVDKVSWRGMNFYFLNALGMDLALRVFTHKSAPAEKYFPTLKKSLAEALPILAENAFGKNFIFSYMKNFPLSRVNFEADAGHSLESVIFFSLVLLGDNWTHSVTKFRMLLERELERGVDIKAIFLFGWLKSDLTWLKMFDTVKFKKLNFFLYTLDGLFDMTGKPITFADAKKLASFGNKSQLPPTAGRLKIPPLKPAPNSEKLFGDDDEEDGSEPIIATEELDIETSGEIETETSGEIETETSGEIETETSGEIETETSGEIEIETSGEIETETSGEIETETSGEIETETSGEIETAISDTLANITSLLKVGAVGRAMLALHAQENFIAQTEPDAQNWAEYLSREVGFILDDPLTLQNLETFDTFSFWASEIEIPGADLDTTFDYLNLAAMIKNFYSPQNPVSFQLQKTWNQINLDRSNVALKTLPAAKNLISVFWNFTDKTRQAFADCLFNAADDGITKVNHARARLGDLQLVAQSVLHSEINFKPAKFLIQQLFNNNGLVRKYLNVDNFIADEILTFCRQFEAVDLTKILANRNAEFNDNIFDGEKIDDYIDAVWNDKNNVALARGAHEPFKGPKRTKVFSVIKQIAFALFSYIYAEKNLEITSKSFNQAAPVAKAKEILADLTKQISRTQRKANFGQVVFQLFTENLAKKISGTATEVSYSDCLLGAKYIELENDLPVAENFGLQEFSLKNRAADFEAEIKYKKPEETLSRAYETALKNYDCGILQLLAQNFLLQLRTSEEEIKRKITVLEKNVDRQIEKICTDFLNDLELARNYSRITDQEKIDFYINAATLAREHYLQTKNAGIYQRFITACKSSINKVSLPQRNALSKRLEKLEEDLTLQLADGETLESRYPILAEVRRQIDLMNLTVAEDYLNRLESEGGSFLTELDVTDSNLKTLEDFLTEYEVLFLALKNANESVEGAFKKQLHRVTRVNRETQDALDFAHSWQGIHSGQSAAIESSVVEILKYLGYSGGKIVAKNVDSPNQKSYTLKFSEAIKTRESYPHPFAAFGTEIFAKGLEVIFLGSNRRYENVAQVLSEMTVDRSVICLMDSAMTLPERRSLAKIMKLTPNYKNVIVLDKVMALYLTKFDAANRGKRMLQTALPFARVQPYTSGGVVAPEMFIGRSEELDQIRDMTGPVFVYGGRQLGKSALLRQVKSIEHNPADCRWAFFIDLKNLDSERALKKIVFELQNAGLLGEVESWPEFSVEMHKLLNGNLRGVDKPKKLLLLMDESDTFLSEKNSGVAIDTLRELLVAFSGQFKFVIAGLHKVIRFEQNSGFGNLRHISVLPFKPSDAMELLVKPMSYLGFRIADDSLISAIFSRTNYYPGSIQYYCKMLVDAVGNNYKMQKFDVAKNPPYSLDDDYLKNMLGNREFQEEIKQKFQLTLSLDDDNYYEILALAVAMIYYENNRPVGVQLEEIKNTCYIFSIDKITKLSDAQLMSLLDEMVALNLLRRTDDKFEFNRYAFWHMLGTEREVNDKLDKYGV